MIIINTRYLIDYIQIAVKMLCINKCITHLKCLINDLVWIYTICLLNFS